MKLAHTTSDMPDVWDIELAKHLRIVDNSVISTEDPSPDQASLPISSASGVRAESICPNRACTEQKRVSMRRHRLGQFRAPPDVATCSSGIPSISHSDGNMLGTRCTPTTSGILPG